MAAAPSAYRDRQFLAVIGDEDSVTGLLLAGIGHVTNPPDSQRNFLICDDKTDRATIEGAFERFTKERKDVGIVLINQHIAEKIRDTVDSFQDAFPAVLEIPSKDHPYDPEKRQRVEESATIVWGLDGSIMIGMEEETLRPRFQYATTPSGQGHQIVSIETFVPKG